jgi:RNA polymerase sigma factor (TIGR02999 family)
MSDEPRGDVTELLANWSNGDEQALNLLMPILHKQLRMLAQSYFNNERSGHTLQATALVHEAYLRLIDQKRVNWQNRAHFFAVAARMMRRILVDHARKRHASKRDVNAKLPLEEDLGVAADVLDDALSKLSEVNPRQAKLVELRFFSGLTIDETAHVLGIAPATVKREWVAAKAWLKKAMSN